MIKKFTIFFNLFLLAGLKLFGQAPIKLPSIQNPQAAELGKYAVYPTAEYTGVLPIQIPLFDIDLKGLKIPITLSYHASGIKLNQMETQVGLGWSLSDFGVINRQVMGVPDEKPKGIYNVTKKSLSEMVAYADRGSTQGEISAGREWLKAMTVGKGEDAHPDIYTYTLPSGSGNFLANGTNTYMTAPYSAKKITRGTISTGGYNEHPLYIRDENGAFYTFDKYSHSLSSTEMQGNWGEVTINSWYPSKITLANTNEEININYVEYWNKQYTSYYQYSIGYDFTSNGITGGATPLNDVLHHTSGTIDHKNLFISEVVFPKGKAIFNYIPSPNSTISTSRFLSEILIYDKNSTLIRKIVFGYVSPANRIKLASVQNIDLSNSSNSSKYVFEYNSLNFPARAGGNGLSVDYWGYYNGTGNTSLIPIFSVHDSEIEVANIRQNVTFSGGTARREPSATHMQAEMLKKITYPTGGSTEFEYEPHKALKDIYTDGLQTYGGTTYAKGTLVKSEDVYTFSYQSSGSGVNTGAVLDITFAPPTPPFSDRAEHPQTVTVKDLTTGVVIVTKWHNSDPSKPLNVVENLNLIDGHNYELRTVVYGISTPGSTGFTSSVRSDIRIKSRIKSTVETIFGGLRIKEIRSYSQNGILELWDSYKYGKGESGLGKTVYDPGIFYKNYSDQKLYTFWTPSDIVGITYRVNYWQRKYFGIENYSSIGFNGAPLFYEEVVKYSNATGGEKYKTAYRFSLDERKTLEDYGFLNAQNYGALSALRFKPMLLEEARYATDAKLVFRKNIGYNYFRASYTSGILVREVDNWVDNGPVYNTMFSQYPSREFGLVGTNWDSQMQLPIREREVQFIYNNGVLQDSVASVKDYEYNSSYTILPSQVQETNSDGVIYKKQTLFPDDITSTSLLGGNLDAVELQGIQKLNKDNVHMVNTPIQSARYKSDVFLNLERSTYKLYNDKPYLYRSFKKKGSELLLKDAEVLSYDSYGNPLEIKVLNGPSISYLWGYSGQYLIAEIKNATYAQVLAALGTNSSTLISQLNSATVADTFIQSTVQTIRTALTNALVSTYTFKPLLGMSSAIDPSGRTTYYNYDGFGRLKETKDTQQKTKETFDYNYRNK